MDDRYEEDDVAGPTTHVRGYHRLPQDDDPYPPQHCQELKPDTEQRKAQEDYSLRDFPPVYTPTQQAPPHGGVLVPLGYNSAPQNFPYAPAATQSQQQSSNNVVVVNQPSSSPTTMTIEQEAPNDHLLFTVCSFVVCCLLGNWGALLCLIPAIVLSLSANSANGVRNYARAKRSANFSLCCTMVVYIQFVITFLILAVFLSVLFIAGLGFIGVEAPKM